ncbi:MAG: alanine racemase [Gammaproteobacteria bacterium]|nr:MAG: alanine racemase [Gammaproteobacteria bacterium]
MVLQGLREEGDLVHFVEHHLWPVVHASEQWAWYRKAPLARELFTWLKVDTGMGRLGVPPEEATAILADTPASDRVRGVMTHLACADVPGNAHTREQLERFAAIRSLAGEARADSIANSAAVLAWPEAQADWARPGILLYGANPLVEPLPAGVKLVPAMTVTAPLVSVREFRQGQGVGYGQHWHAPEAMPVGHVGIGYGDGLPRLLGEDADVRLGGVACRVLGRVSMDSIAIDLRAVDAKYRQVGQAVTIWGPDNPVDRLAHAAGTISYELLTGIRGRIACQ